MKKKLGILGLAAIILLSFNACDNGSTSDDAKKPSGPVENAAPTDDCKALLDDAVNDFAELNLDEGIEKIKQAYNSERNDTTKMYYALAKLALISTKDETVKFMKETCGFKSYPNKLNALIDVAWWEDCLQDGFAENVAKANPEGLNNALDELLKIFTDTYNEVVEISSGMGQSSVTLPASLVDALELEDIFDTADIRAGKAELDVVIAAMGLVKGGLEYVSAFDWTFTTSYIKTNMDVDDFIKAIQSGTKLLTTTNKARLAASKKSFIDAVNLAISSYEYITGDNKVYPTEIKDTLKEYNIFYKAAKELKTALDNGGTFYVPDADISDLTKWPTSESSDWILKIDCKEMFSDGVLDKAIEKDGSSGKVNFYTTSDWEYEYSDGSAWKWDYSEDGKETLLTGKFSSAHKKNVDEVKSKIPGDATRYWWGCDTILGIKVRLPDCITIKGLNEREAFFGIWSEYSDDYHQN